MAAKEHTCNLNDSIASFVFHGAHCVDVVFSKQFVRGTAPSAFAAVDRDEFCERGKLLLDESLSSAPSVICPRPSTRCAQLR
jgi:hypothetical protein